MVLARIAIALGPLLLTLLLGWLTVGGMSLGAGEKDVFLLLPLLAWSLFFLVAYSVQWRRGAASMRGALWAAMVATALLLAPFLLYAIYWVATRLWYVLTAT